VRWEGLAASMAGAVLAAAILTALAALAFMRRAGRLRSGAAHGAIAVGWMTATAGRAAILRAGRPAGESAAVAGAIVALRTAGAIRLFHNIKPPCVRKDAVVPWGRYQPMHPEGKRAATAIE